MKRKLRPGDWVQVRSKEEILATLDANGCLDGMPFMPEMLRFCGAKFQVLKRAHKTCDYSGIKPRSRWVNRTVHLNTRCDGSAHDGCQAGCLLYWKEVWLKLANGPAGEDCQFSAHAGKDVVLPAGGCTESDLWNHTKVPDAQCGTPTYVCQTTQIALATRKLEWWDMRQYLEDFWSGNVGLGRIFSGLLYSVYYHLSEAGIGVGRPMRWFYNQLRFLWGGPIWPRKPGLIPRGKPTPTITLNLQPGELVRVKSHEEILKTVSSDNLNRGMHWDAELVPYCGKTYRVRDRVSRIIHERTGKMQEMKSPCIILDSVVCQARYSACRMFCPKAMYPYWREIWLERVAAENNGRGGSAKSESADEEQILAAPHKGDSY